MEDVILTVLPIWKALLVAREPNYRFFVIVKIPTLSLLRACVVVGVSYSCSRLHLHSVRVDDFGLFLEVEGVALLDDYGVLKLVLKVFLVAAQ